MLRGRWFAWLLYWLAAAAAQWFSAYMLGVLLTVIFRVRAVDMAGLLSTLALTWLADVAAIFLLGWLALANRKAPHPWRLPPRLLLTALFALIILGIPLAVYLGQAEGLRQAAAAVPTPALAVWAGILGFHLPGWLRPRRI